ncbi:MAG: hypothetical protein HY268_03050 [Deltaproteobacteria bacterium]|nr:hypothetical protein [Deltaproteobacteria bacterium]
MRKHNSVLVWSLLAVMLAVGASRQGQAADPDLANVTDMLNGRWVVNPVTDLVAADPVLLSNPNRFSAFNYRFYTNDNRITSYTEPPQTVVTVNCFKNSPY